MIKSFIVFIFSISIFVNALAAHTHSPHTQRVAQFQNEKVNVWETIIQPGAQDGLKMHYHARDRILIPFVDGFLKVTSDRGSIHYLRLKKERAYFLPKDKVGTTHNDINLNKTPFRALVIELQS